MADRKITITGSNRALKTLTYDVGEEINAAPGDQVTWILGKGCGVAAITAITDKPSSPDLFLGGEPKQLANSTSWEGTLNPSDQFGEVESYSITWCSVGGAWNGANVCGIVTDPRIRLSPGQSS